ncbi:hypothetical protein [Cognatishimia sp. MH4019]|uniref:hypothetical protein n=1 Tax=Cognatishimia sp. MH4019 TaxID=2854030 RepID=UPI001CD27E52|nr:hypothetical protein [Cognatishimia sp. MH4019]
MKAIAEYFRDLAADDRYFGAEPPTPDADMLARIAEREIERRVDARFDGENVVLRAAETAPAAAALTAENAEAEQTASEQVAAGAADVEPPVETPEVTDAQDDSDMQEEDVQGEVVDAPSDEDAIAAFMSDGISDQIEDVELPSEKDTSHVEAETVPTPVTHPDADSIAAKLQRIRAVVAPGEDNDDSIFTEDQHADPVDEGNTEIDVAEVEAETTTDVVGAEEVTPEVAFEAEPETAVVEDETFEEEGDEAEDVDMSVVMSALSDDIADIPEAELADDPITQEQEIETEEPAQGRVFRVKSVALEAALAADAEEGDAEDDAVTAPSDESVDTEETTTSADEIDMSIFDEDDDDSDLSPEEEAELMAELAEVARDTEAETETAQDRDGAAILASIDDPEPAIDRIMEKTNDALETPESGRKREAISHLKAAVAATEADRKLSGGEAENPDQTESYREDLAQVVRPKRATPATATRARPERPVAPLKLVAEQRVDATAPGAPVRPRRISKTKVAAPDSEGGFAEFAQSAGASELPDLLEAAAAYTAYVEGRENFTRPQVMRRAAAVAGKDGFSREDGLRSFGQLLREGKINKLSRGQFVVSEETRFRPDARIAGE